VELYDSRPSIFRCPALSHSGATQTGKSDWLGSLDTDAPAKLLSAFFRKADESTLGRLLVTLAVLQAVASPNPQRAWPGLRH
jgi:hypothetical protein